MAQRRSARLQHGVDGVVLTGATVASFGFAGDLAAQRRLLADLIGAGLPVAGLAEEVRSMQQVYRDRLRQDGPQANQERWSA